MPTIRDGETRIRQVVKDFLVLPDNQNARHHNADDEGFTIDLIVQLITIQLAIMIIDVKTTWRNAALMPWYSSWFGRLDAIMSVVAMSVLFGVPAVFLVLLCGLFCVAKFVFLRVWIQAIIFIVAILAAVVLRSEMSLQLY